MAREHLDNQGGTGFTVDNGSGFAVRTKLQKVIDALRTLQSGSGDPTTGLASYQLHINEVSNTSQILKIRNKADDGFTVLGDIAKENFGLLLKEGGTMTGNILGHDGTGAAAPSYSFDQDSDTGMYRAAANTIGFSTNGIERVLISNNGIDIKDGLALRLQDSSGSPFVGLKAPSSLNADLTLTLPAAAPTAATTVTSGNGYALIAVDESGTLGWGLAGGAEGAEGSNNQVFWENDQAVTHSYTITTGKNAGSFGPITINSGVTVTVGSGQTWTVV